MKSGRRDTTYFQPKIKSRLLSLCDDYFLYYSKDNTHVTDIVNKVKVYLEFTLSNEDIIATELIAACLFHALYRTLCGLLNKPFLVLEKISGEMLEMTKESILSIRVPNLCFDYRTCDIIDSFKTMLQKSEDIKCDIDKLKKRIQFIDLEHRLKRKNNTRKDLRKILSEITLSKMDKESASTVFQLLINAMIDAAIKVGSLDNLRETLAYSDAPLHPRLIINAVTHLQKNIVESMLACNSLKVPTSILSEAITILIGIEQTHRIKGTPLTSAFFETTDAIFGDTRFNPNYPTHYPLMHTAMYKNSLYFIKRFLKHPKIGLDELNGIKRVLLPDTQIQHESIDCLFKHLPFYNLENDWLTWYKTTGRTCSQKPFQKIVIENHLFHHQPKWLLFRFATTDEVLPSDVKNEILKKYHMVCYPGIFTYFANNPDHGLFAKKTDVNAVQTNNILSIENDRIMQI